jgi:hypothetical protein
MFAKKKLSAQSWEVPEEKRRDEKDESCIGGGSVENSRPTLLRFSSFVNYFISTSIWKMSTFFRMIGQSEENKGVELTGGGIKFWGRQNEGKQESKMVGPRPLRAG